MINTTITDDNQAVLIMSKYICFSFIIIAALTFAGCASVPEVATLDKGPTGVYGPEEQWGIEVVGIRPTADGRMLNFRYRVLDPVKASALLSRTAKPYIIDNATGKKYPVPKLPKVGALRQRARKADFDRTYFILFSNPGKHIKSGDMIALRIGDLKVENLKVE